MLLSVLTASLFIVQYVFGLRAFFTTKPYVEEPYSLLRASPTLAVLLNTNTSVGTLGGFQFVTGAGALVNTADGARLSSGILFAPLTWRGHKALLNQELQSLEILLQTPNADPLELLATQWEAQQLTLYLLLKHGYTCNPDPSAQFVPQYLCTRGQQTVHYTSYYYAEHTDEALKAALGQVAAPRVLLVSTYSWEQELVRNHLPRAKDLGYFVYDIETKE